MPATAATYSTSERIASLPLKQIVLDILLNAIDAIPAGSSVALVVDGRGKSA